MCVIDYPYPSAFGGGSDRASTGSDTPNMTEMKLHLRGAKRRVNDLQSELRHLRRMAQLNAQSSRDLLRDSFDRIRVMLITNKQLQEHAPGKTQSDMFQSPERPSVNADQEKHKGDIRKVENDLQ